MRGSASVNDSCGGEGDPLRSVRFLSFVFVRISELPCFFVFVLFLKFTPFVNENKEDKS